MTEDNLPCNHAVRILHTHISIMKAKVSICVASTNAQIVQPLVLFVQLLFALLPETLLLLCHHHHHHHCWTDFIISTLTSPPRCLKAVALPVQQLGNQPVTVNVRKCALGEIRGRAADVCDSCSATQYSFNTSSPVCDSPCPQNANCPGGSIMYPDLGFWRSSLHSTLMHSCPRQEACRYASPQDATLCLGSLCMDQYPA